MLKCLSFKIYTKRVAVKLVAERQICNNNLKLKRLSKHIKLVMRERETVCIYLPICYMGRELALNPEQELNSGSRRNINTIQTDKGEIFPANI